MTEEWVPMNGDSDGDSGFAEVEEMPEPITRQKALVDPRLETEAVKAQQRLFEEQAKLRGMQRLDGMAKSWAVVAGAFVPVATIVFGMACLAVFLLALNKFGADLWIATTWVK